MLCGICSPSEKLAVVGVTGSAGKTTTSWLVRSIFEELGQLTGMLGGAPGDATLTQAY